MNRLTRLLFLGLFCLAVQPTLFAQQAGKIQRSEEQILQDKLLREKIERQRQKTKVEEPAVKEEAPGVNEEKALVKSITVSGVTIIPEKDIRAIVDPYQNKELTLKQMVGIADAITALYRKNGHITSRAYLPPQKIKDGLLEIRVVEGVTGTIKMQGNKYFKTALLMKRIGLKSGEIFNYNSLRKDLSRINENPDRNVKAVLAPGKVPATTDVNLEVKDRLPMHVAFDYDNYASRYVDKDRYRVTLSHNNFLGLDDSLSIQYQVSQREDYQLLSARYLFPVTEGLQLGFFTARSRIALGREYRDLNIRGKSQYYSFYATQNLLYTDNILANLTLGFDHKDIYNFTANTETSRDRLRVARIGFDIDQSDNFGRTILTNDVNLGIPNIMGGLNDVDSHCSISGAGGSFAKDNLNLLRVQRMPFDSVFLWKNQFQFTNNVLPAAEQFQIGGIVNVRGYPAAEVVGDQGCSITGEWSLPMYPVARSWKVPFSKATVYDSLRWVVFYDWANARLRRVAAGEEKSRTLRSTGCGLRLSLPEDFFAKVEVAWPLDNTPSDSDHAHVLLEVSKRF
ncbi:MAG: BamA/TamA family outer membrane protein [Candidatus Omnitrophica bacterium]|jgi:hemolysin activation/secretion protein|nr:BamA/TamA family outer membrane protein [Candidatus Omnitrophota bacterium]